MQVNPTVSANVAEPRQKAKHRAGLLSGSCHHTPSLCLICRFWRAASRSCISVSQESLNFLNAIVSRSLIFDFAFDCDCALIFFSLEVI